MATAKGNKHSGGDDLRCLKIILWHGVNHIGAPPHHHAYRKTKRGCSDNRRIHEQDMEGMYASMWDIALSFSLLVTVLCVCTCNVNADIDFSLYLKGNSTNFTQ